jgi:polar amino acid transport system substrate-binding protein
VRLLDKRRGEGKDPLSFAVRYDSVDLWQWVNLYFDNVRADGTYKQNMKYWLESADWKKEH